VQRASAGVFLALIIFSLADAVRSGQVTLWLVTATALVLLYQASSYRQLDLMPARPRVRRRRRALDDLDLRQAAEWIAGVKAARNDTADLGDSLTSRVHHLVTLELDAYENSMPSLPGWDPS